MKAPPRVGDVVRVTRGFDYGPGEVIGPVIINDDEICHHYCEVDWSLVEFHRGAPVAVRNEHLELVEVHCL